MGRDGKERHKSGLFSYGNSLQYNTHVQRRDLNLECWSDLQVLSSFGSVIVGGSFSLGFSGIAF